MVNYKCVSIWLIPCILLSLVSYDHWSTLTFQSIYKKKKKKKKNMDFFFNLCITDVTCSSYYINKSKIGILIYAHFLNISSILSPLNCFEWLSYNKSTTSTTIYSEYISFRRSMYIPFHLLSAVNTQWRHFCDTGVNWKWFKDENMWYTAIRAAVKESSILLLPKFPVVMYVPHKQNTLPPKQVSFTHVLNI
jgi:hypothetical protein